MFDSIIRSTINETDNISDDFANCYKDNQGLYVCNVCGRKRQLILSNRIVRCLCQCEVDADNEEREKQRLQECIRRNIRKGVTERRYSDYRFENDKGYNPKVSAICSRYVEKFAEMKANNIGVLFYGAVGTGKTFYACCIGNALLQKGVRVLMTTLPKLVNDRVQAIKTGKSPVNLNSYDVLVLDDFGVENATQTAYQIIDEWYCTEKPLIITTNLSPHELKNAADIEHSRIYDRVIEMCGTLPILVNAEQLRYKSSRQRRSIAAALLE